MRTLVYQDAKAGTGDNVVGRLVGSALGAVFSEATLTDLYLARKSDQAGEHHGVFDEAIARSQANAAKAADAARSNADSRAVAMRRDKVPEKLVQAYLFKEYYNAAATQKTADALLSQGQFIGDYFADPTRVGGNMAHGVAGGIDAVLLDDKSALQHIREIKAATGKAIDTFNQSSLTQKATMLGNAQGNVNAAVVDAVVSHGAGRVVTAVADASVARRAAGLTPDVPVPDIAPPRVSSGVNLDSRLPNPEAGLDYTPKTINSPNPNIANSHVNGYTEELKLANSVASLPSETVLRYGDMVGTRGADIISVNANGTVTLWDNKFRSSGSTGLKASSTFDLKPGGNGGPTDRFANAIKQARDTIDASNLPPALKAAALKNIEAGNFVTNTPASGILTNSVHVRMCGFKPCGG